MPDPPSPQKPSSQPALDVTLIPEVTSPPAAEPLAFEENRTFQRAREKLILEDLGNEVKARREYAFWIFLLMIAWLVVMMGFVTADSMRWPWASQYVGFDMSDAVLITLVTTTTGTVISVFLIVAKYLYRQKQAE